LSIDFQIYYKLRNITALFTSPDGIIYQDDIVEVKYPFHARNNKIQPNNMCPLLTEDKHWQLHLKQN